MPSESSHASRVCFRLALDSKVLEYMLANGETCASVASYEDWLCVVGCATRQQFAGPTLQKFDIIAKGLSNMVDGFGDRRNSGEIMLMIDCGAEVLATGEFGRVVSFLLLGHVTLRPECQTFIRCEPWSEEEGCNTHLLA